MKNLADDIIELVNFVRPPNDQIDRDLVFTNAKNHLMTFKPNGKKYLGKMMQGDMFGGMQQNTNNGEQIPTLEDLLQPITHEPSTETESKGNDLD